MIFLNLVLGLIAATAASLDGHARIENGILAKEGQFPFQASLLAGTAIHVCGGSIIHEQWVITATHCFFHPDAHLMKLVGVGSVNVSKMTLYKIEKSIMHEKFDKDTLENDIALVKLTEKMTFSDRVKPIALSNEFIRGGVEAVVVGFGFVYPAGPLLFLHTKTIANDECINGKEPVPKSQICAFKQKGHGPCFGDSGGPMAVGGKLIGIVSYGLGETCASDRPDSYTRISEYIKWITNIMATN